jgi:hypothetical protein
LLIQDSYSLLALITEILSQGHHQSLSISVKKILRLDARCTHSEISLHPQWRERGGLDARHDQRFGKTAHGVLGGLMGASLF